MTGGTGRRQGRIRYVLQYYGRAHMSSVAFPYLDHRPYLDIVFRACPRSERLFRSAVEASFTLLFRPTVMSGSTIVLSTRQGHLHAPGSQSFRIELLPSPAPLMLSAAAMRVLSLFFPVTAESGITADGPQLCVFPG